MRANSIDIFCIQETRKLKSDSYVTDDGYHVYLSGSGDASREWAGVGFIVSPSSKHFVIGFDPFSNRICSMRVKISGGCSALFCIYAPHNLRPLPERVQFYDDLEVHTDKVSVNGSRWFWGDFNARIGQRQAGEDSILGPYCFGRSAVHAVEVSNRDLLLEFCASRRLLVTNTLLDLPDHQNITYYEVNAKPMDPITFDRFNILDLCLVEATDENRVLSIQSDRFAAIASHHFPVVGLLDMHVECVSRDINRLRRNLAALQVSETQHQVATDFMTARASHTHGPIKPRWNAMCDAMDTAMDRHIPKMPRQRNKPS